ncbi:hypothetical protein [Streptomyces sp. NPDC049881]|uniref:hypothetical protein n=1 Tax=Streptomyces sp. NPDC049881 TaxID=3155778 RepID=UPI003418F1F5
MTTHNGADDEPREGVILPSGGGEAWPPQGGGQGPAGPAATPPSSGTPWGQPWGPDAQQAQGGDRPALPGSQGGPPAALPPQATPPRPSVPPDSADAAATQMIPPIRDDAAPPGPGERDTETTTQIRAVPHRAASGRHTPQPGQHPQGAQGDEGATQMIPPVRDDAAPTQMIPPVRDDAAPTQMIPPIAAGDPEATTQLRAVRPGHTPPAAGHPQEPPRPHEPQYPQNPQAQNGAWSPQQPAPQGPPGGFDNLFRSASEPPGPPGPGGPQYPYDDDDEPRRSPKVLVAVAVIVALAVVGLAAGAMLGGGDDDGGQAAAPSSSESADPSADPSGDAPAEGEEGGDDAEGGDEEPTEEADDAEARAQATALSDLLAQSNSSRDAVIRSVENIRGCRELEAATTDLRAARDQRNNLVSQLQGLDIGALENSAELSQALTEAWQASAEADEHYAVWAEEARTNPQVCQGGTAQHTDRANQGDAASGRATEAKQRAAGLWNPLASGYGLPEREPSAL